MGEVVIPEERESDHMACSSDANVVKDGARLACAIASPVTLDCADNGVEGRCGPLIIEKDSRISF